MKIGSRAQINPDRATVWNIPSPAIGRITAGDPMGDRGDVVTFEIEGEVSEVMRRALETRGINVAYLEEIAE